MTLRLSSAPLAALLAITGLLSGCGGGGGGTGSPSAADAQVAVSGIAIDGFLKSAQAFLDLNDNGSHDEGEPTALTDSNGAFTLMATPAQKAAHSVVVLAIAGQTVDQDSPGVAVTKGFTLMAPPGKPELVSPITTSVMARVSAGQSLRQAEDAVKADLGMPGIDIYKNYMSAKAADPAYQELHNLAAAMVEVAKNVETSDPKSSLPQKLASFRTSVDTEVLGRLSAIKAAPSIAAARTVVNDTVSVGTLRLYAAAAQLTSMVDLAANTVTLNWVDSFPSGTRYDIKTQNSDNSYTTVESMAGAGGSNNKLSWSRALTTDKTYRIDAQIASATLALQTPQKLTTVTGRIPGAAPEIVVSSDEPASGSVQLSIGNGFTYPSVSWYSDLRLIGTSTTGAGNPVTWNTSTETNSAHLIVAKIQVASDSYTEVRKVISVANSNLALAAQVSGTTGTINVDVSASSQYGIARVEAAFDGAPQPSLIEPNASSGRFSSSFNVYRFSVNAAQAGSGSHTMVVTAIDKQGARKSLTVPVPISNLPLITLSSPADGALVSGTLSLTGTSSSDRPGAVTTTASLGDYQFLSTTNANFTGTMSLASLPAGSYTLTVRATDSSKSVTVLQRTVTVTSSSALAFQPNFTLGAGGQLLVAKDEYLLFRSQGGDVILRNVPAGTEVVLSGGAAATRYLQDWQISSGYVYANGKGADCNMACVYQWTPQGAMQNLSNSNPYSASPSDMGGRSYDRYAVAHDGLVIWVNDQANTATQLGGPGWYTLYDTAKGTASKISAPEGSRFVGNSGYDFVVEANGTVSFYYWARYGFVDVNAVFDLFRWSSATNTSTKLSNGNTVRPKTDGSRWIWQQPASGGTGATTLLTQPLSGGAFSTLTTNAGNHVSRDGVTAWLETSTSTSSGRLGGVVATVTGLKAISGNGTVTTISSAAGVMLYAVGGGHVVFGEAGKIYTWNANSKTSTLRLETAPGQILVSGSTLYFVMGTTQVVYKITMD